MVQIMGNHVCYVFFTRGMSMIDMSGWSAMKKLKHSMLKRAFNENRGGEVILLMQWRLAQVRHEAEKDKEALSKFEEQNTGQPRALRALNLIEAQNGKNVVHKLTVDVDKPEEKNPKALSVRDLFQHLADMPVKDRIIYRDSASELMDKLTPLHADHYDPMEGLRITTGYALACEAYHELDYLDEIFPEDAPGGPAGPSPK